MSIQCQFKICFGIPDLSTDTSSINEFQTLGMKSSVAKKGIGIRKSEFMSKTQILHRLQIH